MSALREFADKAVETNRIGFGDLRRLKRDVLPQRIATTDEAELLLAIDGALARAACHGQSRASRTGTAPRRTSTRAPGGNSNVRRPSHHNTPGGM